MISKILNSLQTGLYEMRTNSKMLLVGILVFVFPLLFVWVTQNFFNTAYDNIYTEQKNKIGILHDSLSSILRTEAPDSDLMVNLITTLKSENKEISKIRIVDEINNEFVVVMADDESQIGTIVQSDRSYRDLPFSSKEVTFINELVIDGDRTSQAFRKVTVADDELFIFTEHSYAVIDSVMLARQQQSYFGLTAIFLFLIALAYWLNKQTNWKTQHLFLEEKIRERDLFSNMIAHEFRTPLTAIKGYASLLEESETISSEEKKYSLNIKSSAERLVLLVNDFLEVARLQSGQIKLELVETDVRSVLSDVANNLKELANKKQLQIETILPKEPVLLRTDRNRMIQIITNIVTNSIKYTNSGKVLLECEESRSGTTIYIKDTGTGISAEDQQKLFQPFTRVGGVDETATTGTGLGMWITKQLVSLLGGNIGVESIKGVGTHVVITFKTN